MTKHKNPLYFLKAFYRILGIASFVLLILSSIAVVNPAFAVGSIEASAQTPGTLTECNFESSADNPNAFQDCIGQIFQFIVVISILLIMFRIALSALKSYNPLDGGGSATKNATQVVWDIVLGLLFIGGPYLILSTINPALLNFQLVDLGGILGNDSSGGSSQVGSTDADGQVILSSSGVTANKASTALTNLTTGPGQPVIDENGNEVTDPAQIEEIKEQNRQQIIEVNSLFRECNFHVLGNLKLDKCDTWETLPNDQKLQIIETSARSYGDLGADFGTLLQESVSEDTSSTSLRVRTELKLDSNNDVPVSVSEIGSDFQYYPIDFQITDIDPEVPRLDQKLSFYKDADGNNKFVLDKVLYTIIRQSEANLNNPYIRRDENNNLQFRENVVLNKGQTITSITDQNN